jgi:hypothetical protein
MTSAVKVAPARVRLNGLDIGVVNDGNVVLTYNKLDGWHGGAGVRTNFTPRSNEHGSFDGPAYRSELVITIGGNASGPSRAAVAATIHKLTGALGDGQLGVVEVHDPDYGNLSVRARLSDAPQVDWGVASQFVWQIQVTAPDPLKYGDELTWVTDLPKPGSSGLTYPLFGGTGKLEYGTPGEDGRITLINPGTAKAWPVFQVNGPVLGGLSITDVTTGRQIVYAGDVPDEAVLLIIDSANGRASLNGADRSAELTVKQWFAVPPGGAQPITPGVLLENAYLLDLGDDTATLSSPDLVDVGADTALLAASAPELPALTVQFATFGAAGQTGQLSAVIRPAYW